MFPKDFIWGAATAAAQIEGGYSEGGRGMSIWDSGASHKTQNYILYRHTPFTACNHYAKWKEDVALMNELGLKGYRFSLSWSRLIPDGTGKINAEGARFYSDLIDELLKYKIQPFVTLYHWDLPLALHNKGGWLSSDSPKWFEYYVKEVLNLYSDRVKFFITFNEPAVFITGGYMTGTHAPFHTMPVEDVFRAAHNVLLANGLATIAIREKAKQKAEVGQAFGLSAKIPLTNSEEDISAAKLSFFESAGAHFWDTWFPDAIIDGRYSQKRLSAMNAVYDLSDMKIINQKPDFVGFTTYFGNIVKAGDDGNPQICDYDADTDFTSMGWPVTPDCLYWNVKFLYEKYKLPLYIFENGVALSEWSSDDGRIKDDCRISFIKNHLQGLKRAIDEGVDVKSYFYWSLMDNFEWSHGYSKRFGLIRVNYKTGERILKDSALWYKNIIKTNGKEI